MWIPAGVVYIIAGLILFAGWLRESDNRARAFETLPRAATLVLLALLALLTSYGPLKEAKLWAADVTGGDYNRGRGAIHITAASPATPFPA